MRHAHRGAFDMPPGPAGSDRGLPDRLAGLRALPQREVADIVLAVLVGLHTLADALPLRVEAREPAVRRPGRDPEEHRAVVGPVSVSPVEQRRDEVDDLVDVLRRARQDIGDGHPERRRVGEEHPEIAVCEHPDRFARRRGAADDLVVDVGDVHDPGDGVATPAKVADEKVREQERPEVPNVGRAVDRRPARVDADGVAAQRDERSGVPGQRVVKPERHRASSTVAMASAEIDRPAPSAPSRFPVEALTLTADGSTWSRLAIVSRIASRYVPSRGRAAMIVRSTVAARQPAAATRLATSPTNVALSIPDGVRASAGNRRPRSPRPAAPSRASEIAWSATSPSE